MTMTREEAIKTLHELWRETNDSWYEETYKMAIEALSQPNMIPIKLEKRYPESRDEDITDAFMQGYLKGKENRPTGEWIPHATSIGGKKYIEYSRCSECGEMALVRMNFCPNCGSIMKGGGDE